MSNQIHFDLVEVIDELVLAKVETEEVEAYAEEDAKELLHHAAAVVYHATSVFSPGQAHFDIRCFEIPPEPHDFFFISVSQHQPVHCDASNGRTVLLS